MLDDKINIYLPKEIANSLDDDAISFEIFKNDGFSINRNRFLSSLIIGYAHKYEDEIDNYITLIENELKNEKISKNRATHIAKKIVENVFMSEISNGRNGSVVFSLKPTGQTKNIIEYIYLNLNNNSVSQYFCKLFLNYLKKPRYEREQLIFKNTYDVISDAIKKNKMVYFSTTRSNTMHEVSPFTIANSKEELHNYLLCDEIIEDKHTVQTYRLNRIKSINMSNRKRIILEENIGFFKKMIMYGPQYVIDHNELTTIVFNDSGIKTFNKIYINKPNPIKRTRRDNGEWECVFDCSKKQVDQFLNKFEDKTSFIIKDHITK